MLACPACRHANPVDAADCGRCGASLMGALFALGSGGIALFGLAPGSASGLQLTFAAAAVAAGTALAGAGWGLRGR